MCVCVFGIENEYIVDYNSLPNKDTSSKTMRELNDGTKSKGSTQ